MARRFASRVVAAGALAAAAMAPTLLGGCRGDVSDNRPRQFFPDLDDQPKYKAQTESTFFKEYVTEEGEAYGREMREPVVGTVAFGKRAEPESFAGVDFAQRDEYLRPNHEVATGRRWVTDANGKIELDENGQPKSTYVERIPIPVTMDLVRLGQKKFDIMCMPCHGMTGMGDGMVGRVWAYALPNFHDPKYLPGGEFGQDGFVFDRIRHGKPNPGGQWPLLMPSYARKLSIRETWAVVSYFRALQVHDNASPDMLTPAMRQRLEQKRASAGVVSSAAPASPSGGKEGSL